MQRDGTSAARSTCLAAGTAAPQAVVNAGSVVGHAPRISTRFPGGATFNIVGPRRLADRDDLESNNIENGTSAARESNNSEYSSASRRQGRSDGIYNSKFLIQNSDLIFFALHIDRGDFMKSRALFCSVVLVASAAVSAEIPDDLFNSLEYRLVGPFRGGRVTAVSGVPGDSMTYYMGSTGGGVWKTTDAGLTWFNVSDVMRELEPKAEPEIMGEVDPTMAGLGLLREPNGGLLDAVRWERRPGDAFGTASIGAIAVAPSDTNVVYVGTGSACPRGNVSPGDGVYKSTDAGGTWRHIGLPEAGQIGRIVVHPTDPDIVYAAVLGHIFGSNPERGVYRSTDGGLTWFKVLFVSDEAGAVDLAMNPANPRVLYAAMWQARRTPWNMISGGPGSGLYKSTDGGNTWVELERRAARGRQGTDRGRRVAGRTEPGVGAGGSRRGRPLPLR